MFTEELFGRKPERPKFDQKKLLFAEASEAARLMDQGEERTRRFVFGWAPYLVSKDQIDDKTHVQVGFVLGDTVFVYRITQGQRTN